MEEQYYIVRTNRAGVFFGKIKEKKENSLVMTNVRKLFYWSGAYSVEDIAVHGVKNIDRCQFTCYVDEMEISEPIQIIPCTEESFKIIYNVKVWSYE